MRFKRVVQIFVFILIMVFSVYAEAFEIYATSGYSIMNPAEYNAKIAEVSVGEGFGNVLHYGAGIKDKFGEVAGINTNFRIEGTYSSQSKDAYVQNIATGEKRKFGSNSLSLITLTPSIDASSIVEFLGFLGFEPSAGIGIPLELALLKSSNEEQTITSSHFQIGIKPYLSYQVYIGIIFVEARAGYKWMIKKEINTSCFELSISAGIGY